MVNRLKNIVYKNKLFLCFILISALMVQNFSVYATGNQDYFSDLNSNAYYYNAVNEMYKKGYIIGYPDGEFKAKNEITVAESLTILFRLSGIEISHLEKETKMWYDDIISVAVALGVISEDIDPNSYATRLDIAKYIVKLYQLDITKTEVSNVFVDTNLIIPNTMYQYNIFVGAPVILEDGSEGVAFIPQANVTRGDFCLVLSRLNEKIKSPYLDVIKIGKYEVPNNPKTKEDFMVLFKYMGEEGITELKIPYFSNIDNVVWHSEIRPSIKDAFEDSFSLYPEYFSLTPNLSIKKDIYSSVKGVITLKLSNKDISDEDIFIMRDAFDSGCSDIILKLEEEGLIGSDIPNLEKSKIIYEYVIENVEYDTSYSVNSFTGYGAVIEGKAVCQGYTAMYNKLCRLIGLDVRAVTGVISETQEQHMWTSIKDEDTEEWYYYDTTFDDPVPDRGDYCDFSYFHLLYDSIMIGRELN